MALCGRTGKEGGTMSAETVSGTLQLGHKRVLVVEMAEDQGPVGAERVLSRGTRARGMVVHTKPCRVTGYVSVEQECCRRLQRSIRGMLMWAKTAVRAR